MPISRERAVDLSHRMIERVLKTPGVELAVEREYARNQILKGLLAWDKESGRFVQRFDRKIGAREDIDRGLPCPIKGR